jgi:hypothetical protein
MSIACLQKIVAYAGIVCIITGVIPEFFSRDAVA